MLNRFDEPTLCRQEYSEVAEHRILRAARNPSHAPCSKPCRIAHVPPRSSPVPGRAGPDCNERHPPSGGRPFPWPAIAPVHSDGALPPAPQASSEVRPESPANRLRRDGHPKSAIGSEPSRSTPVPLGTSTDSPSIDRGGLGLMLRVLCFPGYRPRRRASVRLASASLRSPSSVCRLPSTIRRRAVQFRSCASAAARNPFSTWDRDTPPPQACRERCRRPSGPAPCQPPTTSGSPRRSRPVQCHFYRGPRDAAPPTLQRGSPSTIAHLLQRPQHDRQDTRLFNSTQRWVTAPRSSMAAKYRQWRVRASA